MQQHPVPQNVTQYQFRLVGDMTLKQFLELAGGLVVAWLFYSSNLIFIFKWPLAISSILVGFGLAFFPIEDRPLDQWIINFLKSIYAPTRYIWKKSQKVPAVFTFEPHPVEQTTTVTKTVKAPSLADLQPKAVSDVSDEERQRLNVLDSMLAQAAPATPVANPQAPIVEVKKPAITVHKLKPMSEIHAATIFQSAPRPQPMAKPLNVSLKEDVAVPQSVSTEIIKPAPADPAPAKPAAPSVIFAQPSMTVQPKPAAPTAAPAKINLPAAPTSPNLIVGMVVDRNSKLIENAIVQILSSEGVPVRAIKTNSLGQFYTSTPLARGEYVIEAEKEGNTFPANKLMVEDKIIAPILLKAN